jgi:hypothetical protein
MLSHVEESFGILKHLVKQMTAKVVTYLPPKHVHVHYSVLFVFIHVGLVPK